MKNIKEVRERLENIEEAIKDLVGRDNPIELNKLIAKAETLDWVLGDVRFFMSGEEYMKEKDNQK